MHLLLSSFLVAVICSLIEATSVTIEGVTDELSPENEQYASALLNGQAAFQEAQSIFQQPDFYARRNWRREYETRDGYMVFSRGTSRGRMFAISEILDAPASDIMRDVWGLVNNRVGDRNPVMTMQPIVTLSPNADIVRMTSPAFAEQNLVRLYRGVPMPAGAIDGYVAAFRPVDLPDQPNDSSSNSPLPSLNLAAIRLRPDITRAPRTYFDSIIVLDLKGNQDREFARQAASSAIALLSEQAVRQFRDRSGY